MRPLFNVTYWRMNEDEAAAGDSDRKGFLDESVSLADAIRAIQRDEPAASDRTFRYPSDSDPRAARSFYVVSNEWETGDDVTYSIHFPGNTTPASRARLCRLLANRL